MKGDVCMGIALDGIPVAVLGGDAREYIVVQWLLKAGANVLLVGYEHAQFPQCPHVSLKEAIASSRVFVAPMSNTDQRGRIKAVPDGSVIMLDAEGLSGVLSGSLLIIGYAQPVVRSAAQQLCIHLVELAEDDAVAILNSIPTAEGAVALAMEKLPITIHGCKAVVLGFGRCAQTLARVLHSLGARTTVVARNTGQQARAQEMGVVACGFEGLYDAVIDADVVFNTVPALVLTESVLTRMNPDTLVIDIASSPGGTDFKAAERLGIEAILALGLPGKVAPKTAGEIMAQGVMRAIRDYLS